AWQSSQLEQESPLSLREQEVLTLVAEGHGSDAIASRLGLSKRTVDNHRANIKRKLGFNNTVELIRYAIEHDLLMTIK
ncbi:LuxR C-terminal-related transcriptional regulator, partial [Oceanospirillum sp. HFRX-1_2]